MLRDHIISTHSLCMLAKVTRKSYSQFKMAPMPAHAHSRNRERVYSLFIFNYICFLINFDNLDKYDISKMKEDIHLANFKHTHIHAHTLCMYTISSSLFVDNLELRAKVITYMNYFVYIYIYIHIHIVYIYIYIYIYILSTYL